MWWWLGHHQCVLSSCVKPTATRETIDLSNKMADAGADAVLVVTPCYYKASMTNEALSRHFSQVHIPRCLATRAWEPSLMIIMGMFVYCVFDLSDLCEPQSTQSRIGLRPHLYGQIMFQNETKQQQKLYLYMLSVFTVYIYIYTHTHARRVRS